MSATDFEQQVEKALELAWRAQWPEEGPNFINPGTVARSLAPRVAAAIEAAAEGINLHFPAPGQSISSLSEQRKEAALAALRGEP